MEQPKSYIDGNNTVIWYLPSMGRRYYHRLNGPAIIRSNGTKIWWLNDKRHREDGPAVERADGSKDWYLNGNMLLKKEIEFWLTENAVNLKTNEGKMAFKLRWL